MLMLSFVLSLAMLMLSFVFLLLICMLMGRVWMVYRECGCFIGFFVVHVVYYGRVLVVHRYLAGVSGGGVWGECWVAYGVSVGA
jgi:hypothetical protein